MFIECVTFSNRLWLCHQRTRHACICGVHGQHAVSGHAVQCHMQCGILRLGVAHVHVQRAGQVGGQPRVHWFVMAAFLSLCLDCVFISLFGLCRECRAHAQHATAAPRCPPWTRMRRPPAPATRAMPATRAWRRAMWGTSEARPRTRAPRPASGRARCHAIVRCTVHCIHCMWRRCVPGTD